jgi:biotin operon repressor
MNVKIYDDPRLAPEMASFRLLVLAFVRDYIALLGDSPSQGEIAAKLKSNRKRVMKALRSLEREGLLIRTPGTRGLKLPSMRDEAVRQLRSMGWVVDEDICHAAPPEGLPVTKRTLLTTPALDYLPSRTGDHDGSSKGEDAPRKAG